MKISSSFFLLLLFLLVNYIIVGQQFTKININNVSTFVWNDGRMDISPTESAGFEYWKNTKRFSVFASGVYWGGYVNNQIRVGGTVYSSSLYPGNENISQTLFRVRKDYKSANLEFESDDLGKSAAEIKTQYGADTRTWPWKLGAPYVDVDKDGWYSNAVDIPGFPNADQTVWLVCNDFAIDRGIGNKEYVFSSTPTGIELQVTAWAYSKIDLLKGVVFKSYKLINRNKDLSIRDMYLGIFADPDLGDAGDDYAGCDTLLGLGFVYNAKDSDLLFGKNLTAYGNVLLQSPIINGTENDKIIKNGKTIRGKKYLGMTTFRGIVPEETSIVNPLQRNYNTLVVSRPRYNPITRGFTNFPLSGDPAANTGYLDGIIDQAGDKRIQINSGPFNMAPGDTQEVMFAQIVTAGTNRLGLITYLKYLAKYVKDFYEKEMFKSLSVTDVRNELPTNFSLSQNYPNPFNPETTIDYAIPVVDAKFAATTHVTLKIYDVLGREVATLVDENKQPGNYKINFNVETRHQPRQDRGLTGGASLPSGVYYYRLLAGNFSQTKKLVLMK